MPAWRGSAPFMSEHRHEFMIETLTRGSLLRMGSRAFRSAKGPSPRRTERPPVSVRPPWSRFGSARTDDEIAAVGLAHEFGLRMPELLLMRIDKMTMAASVEARAPFLDPQLVDFAARLPLSLHWADGGGKRILKRRSMGSFQTSFSAGAKQGFGAPVWRWLSSLRTIGEEEFLREPLFEYLDEEGTARLLRETPRRVRGSSSGSS